MILSRSAVHSAISFEVEEDRHSLNLFAVVVGESFTGRKGTSAGRLLKLLEPLDTQWREKCTNQGLISGEGLIYHVRDPEEPEGDDPARAELDTKKSKRDKRPDPGVIDKRLLVLESEFAGVLKVLQRDGCTLSAVLRQVWDGKILSTLAKNSPTRSTDHHVSIIGHITLVEVNHLFDEIEAASGLGNRFLWICSRRSKCLPEGGAIDEVEERRIIGCLRRVLDWIQLSDCERIDLDEEARSIWDEEYPRLTTSTPTMLGAMTSRAAPIVRRLACIYALLETSSTVRAKHLRAALAVWTYCEASCQHIFGGKLGDPMADEILRALKGAPAGLTRTEIRDLFGRNRSAEQIGRALQVLVTGDLAHSVSEDTGGRNAERWFSGKRPTTNTTETTEDESWGGNGQVGNVSGEEAAEVTLN